MTVKVLSLKQLRAKKFDFIPDLPEEIQEAFGTLTKNFVMIIYGASGNGKSNLTMKLLNAFIKSGRILYVSYEEGHGFSIQKTANRQLGETESGICFANHTMNVEELKKRLKKKRSEQYVVLDSLQYMRIKTDAYFNLKESLSNKGLIFISHASGKKPRGKTAEDIEFDADIKVRVEGYVAFIVSRFGGKEVFLIWEEGARKYWGEEKFNKLFKIKKPKSKKKAAPAKEEPKQIESTKPVEENEEISTNVASI